jgi:hypothetical protein
VPGPKLIWQFGELGYDVSINQNGRTGAKPIRWEYQQDANRQKLYRVYSELNKLKLTQPAFQTEEFQLNTSSVVKRIMLNHATMNVLIIGNFDVQPQIAEFGFQNTGKWYDYFTGVELEVSNLAARINLQPGEFHIYTTVKLPTPVADLVPWSGTPDVVTGVRKNEAVALGLSIFPNPTATEAFLKVQNHYRGTVTIVLRDIQGRLLEQKVLPKKEELLAQTISLHQRPAGVYFLEIIQHNAKAVQKLVKW